MTELSTGNESVTLIAQATFGRDSAMFESLLGFVAQLSVVLWGLVLLTVIVRFVGVGMYRRGARRRAARATLVDTLTPSPAAPAAVAPMAAMPTIIDLVQPAAVQLTDAVANTFGEVLQQAEAPAAVAGSVNVQGSGHRNWRSETRTTAHLPALASNSPEA